MGAVYFGLIAALAWGVHDFSVRFVSRNNPLMTSLLSVLFFGTIFYAGFWSLSSPTIIITFEAAWLSVLAGLFFLAASVALYIAFHRGPVRLVAPIIASYPIMSLILANIAGTPSTSWQWLAVLIIVVGIIIVALSDQDSDTDSPSKGRAPLLLTAFFAALSATGFAFTFAVGQHAASIADENMTIFITRLSALLALALFMGLRGWRLFPDRRLILLLAFMGLMDALALYCVLYAGILPDARFAAVVSSVFGLVTILLSWLFLKEKLSIWQWLGCAITFSGIAYLAL